jgi:beta-glucosidase-like glycosyl hydrolase
MKPGLASLRAKDLSDDELLMQCFFAKHTKETLEPWLDFARRGLLGGIHTPVWFTREDLARLQAECPIPLLFVQNAESGARLGDGLDGTEMPMQMCLGAAGDETLAEAMGRAVGLEMRANGTHWALGPVLDIAMEPLATCLDNRALGGTPELVARLGAAVVRGFQSAGVLVAAKHFPGKGRATNDTHIVERDLDVPLEVLEREEFLPYRRAIRDAALSGVMASHLCAKALDPDNLCTCSKKCLDHLFGPMGFRGLVITDSIAMGAMVGRYTEAQRVTMPIEAGNHAVLGDWAIEPATALAHLRAALAAGRLTRSVLEPRVDALLAAKRRFLPGARAPAEPDRAANERLSRDIARRAVTELARAGAPALDLSKRHFFLVVSDSQSVSDVPEVQISGVKQGEAAEWLRRRAGPKHIVREIQAYPPPGNIAGCIRHGMRETDRTVVVACATCGANKGTAHLSRPVASLLEGLAKKTDAVVMLGNPYAAMDIQPVPRVIFGYQGAHTVEAALDVLFGGAKATGTLPVPMRPPGF